MPKVSVIMSIYKSEEYLRDSIDSILCQTYKDFEFIIVDDASPDSSRLIVQSYNDERIRLIVNEENQGLAWSLNRALDAATGEYIARMDTDDIAQPERLEKQVAFLEENQDIICYGSWARYFGENLPWTLKLKRTLHLFDTFRVPLAHEDIKASLLFWIPFVHPTVMFNTKLLKQHHLRYNPDYRRSQDYELWSRLCFFGKTANTSEPLLNYRLSSSNAGTIAHENQIKARESVVTGVIERLIGRKPTSEELSLHIRIFERESFRPDDFAKVKEWFGILSNCAAHTNQFDSYALIHAISNEWRKVCTTSFAFPRNITEYRTNSTIGKLKWCSIYDWTMFLLYKLK